MPYKNPADKAANQRRRALAAYTRGERLATKRSPAPTHPWRNSFHGEWDRDRSRDQDRDRAEALAQARMDGR